MKVKRIVANIETWNPAEAERFYHCVLGLDVLMDHGWIVTYGSHDSMSSVQVSFASEGGSGTPVPDLSIEVDDVDAALQGMQDAGFAIEYGPADEPWGVRRFYVRDPFMCAILSAASSISCRIDSPRIAKRHALG